jgi:hypothetical protein
MEIPVMAYFAELENSTVIRVISVDNVNLLNSFGVEEENIGIKYCQDIFGNGTFWVQTSYNTYANEHKDGKEPFRKNYAGIGYVYDVIKDAFIPPKPESKYYVLDEDRCIWVDNTPKLETMEIGVARV